jgi:hypothetical protein
MEPTAEKGIFVGYSEVSKAYRIYIPALKRVVVRRDVKFEEQKAFERSQELDQREPPTPSTQQGSPGTGFRATGVRTTGVSRHRCFRSYRVTGGGSTGGQSEQSAEQSAGQFTGFTV